MTREFPQKSPARKTEDRSPHTVEIHGDDRHVHALHDAFHAAAERHHLADARHLPFGENANQLAILQSLRRARSE